MGNENKKHSLLHMNDPKEMGLDFSDDLFVEANQEEKESVVIERKSVSYWADAMRRFKANTVAMVALGVFVLLLIFAFVGPMIVPYSYEGQFRSGIKLNPFQYSEAEQQEQAALKNYDAVFSTELVEGGVAGLTKGNYYITIGKTNYNFILEKSVSKKMAQIRFWLQNLQIFRKMEPSVRQLRWNIPKVKL